MRRYGKGLEQDGRPQPRLTNVRHWNRPAPRRAAHERGTAAAACRGLARRRNMATSTPLPPLRMSTTAAIRSLLGQTCKALGPVQGGLTRARPRANQTTRNGRPSQPAHVNRAVYFGAVPWACTATRGRLSPSGTCRETRRPSRPRRLRPPAATINSSAHMAILKNGSMYTGK